MSSASHSVDPEVYRELKKTGGYEFTASLYHQYVNDTTARLGQLADAVASLDAVTVNALAQLLESAAGQVGAQQLQMLFGKLAAQADDDYAMELLDQIGQELQRFRGDVEMLFDETGLGAGFNPGGDPGVDPFGADF